MRIPLFLILLIIFSSFAQKTNDSLKNDALPKKSTSELDRIVVTATRKENETFNLARSVTVLNQRKLLEKNQFSVLDALDDEIGIWIEKRTVTTSDPVIRGLSGGNVLALVNGNSLTTFWGEGGFAGDDMYGKIDGESIERIEVVRGPSSVLYGSNALGGVINLITKKPKIPFTEKGLKYGARLKGASGSASEYLMGRVETWGANPYFRYFIGSTMHRSEDMRVGGGIGSVTPSGGKDWSIDVSSELKLNNSNFLTLNSQYMNRPETYRTYRPTQSNSNERLGVELGYRSINTCTFYDMLKINLYQQYKKDIRYWYKDTSLKNKTEEGYAWWRTIGADIQSDKNLFSGNTLIWGASYHLDLAESPDDEQFTMITDKGDQKAAPNTKWHNGGLFIQDEWSIGNVLTITGSFRYDYFNFIAEDDTFYTKPGDKDTTKNRALTDPSEYSSNAFTGGVGAVFHLGENMNLATSWSRGFRMTPPSFGFRQTGQGVLVPNGFLDPVTADLFEISPRFRSDVVNVTLTGYYTKFHNFQQPIHGEYKGDSTIDYNNNGIIEPDERVYVNRANGDAYVTGVEFEMDFNIGSICKSLNGLRFIGGLMYNYGRMQFPGEEEMALRHTHPLRGIAKLRYDEPSELSRWWCELSADVVDWYNQIDKGRLLSDVGYLENPQDPNSGLYRSYGLPSYYVFDIRLGIKFFSNVTMTFAVENLLDKRYRTAHSRIDASGRNVLVGLDISLPDSYNR